MSITDELREYVDMFKDKVAAPATLRVIADRIDAEHEREVTMACGEAIAKLGNKVVREYVKLPVDADGVPIRIGDKIDVYQTKNVEVVGVGDQVVFTHYYMGDYHKHFAGDCHHHHEPTVEDVLRDFAKCWDDPAHYAKGELVETFAAKLRLRED